MKTGDDGSAGGSQQAVLIMSGLVCAALVTLALAVLETVLRPFVIAIFLCFLIHPLVHGKSRARTIAGNVFAIVLLAGFFSIGQRIVANDLSSYRNNKPEYVQRVEAYKRSTAEFLQHNSWARGAFGLREAEPAPEESETPESEADEQPSAEDVVDRVLPLEEINSLIDAIPLTRLIGSGATFFLGVFGESLVVLFSVILILLDVRQMPDRLRRVYGDARAEKILAVVREITHGVRRYITLKVVISLLTATAGLAIMLVGGVHYAATFAIVIFFFNFVPYVGSFAATVFPATIALLQFESPLDVLWIVLALAAVQLLVGNLVEPRVQGKDLSVSPIVIILALGFWGWLWGISGMILAVPITVTARIIMEQFETTRSLALMMASDD